MIVYFVHVGTYQDVKTALDEIEMAYSDSEGILNLMYTRMHVNRAKYLSYRVFKVVYMPCIN